MIMEIPTYQPIIKKPEEDAVAKSIAKPHAFAKPGSDKPAAKGTGTRFRPMQYKRTPGRPRTRKRDPREVKFY